MCSKVFLFLHFKLIYLSFNSLHIKKINRETEKSVSIVFDVPKKLESTYSFKAGQYLTLKLQLTIKRLFGPIQFVALQKVEI